MVIILVVHITCTRPLLSLSPFFLEGITPFLMKERPRNN